MCKSYITHTDADGLISALLFQQYNKDYKFKGFYNLSTFFLTDVLSMSDIAVDLDMNKIPCIGHHCCPIENPLSENPNKSYLNNYYTEYFKKCPFNTVLILLNKYNHKVKDLKELAVLMFADGMFTYFDKYKDNCINWLNRYNMNYIYEMFEENKEEVLRIINEEIVPIFSNTGKYNDLKVEIKNNEIVNKEVIKTFCKYVIDVFDLDVKEDIFLIHLPEERKYITKTYEITNGEDYENIVKRIQNNSIYIVSASLTRKHELKITTTEKLSLK